jgi:hypothetical protein
VLIEIEVALLRFEFCAGVIVIGWRESSGVILESKDLVWDCHLLFPLPNWQSTEVQTPSEII